jgi:2-iminobutanoate/2-iminopropanoate deaminase
MRKLILSAAAFGLALTAAGVAGAAPIKFIYATPEAFIAKGVIVPPGSEIFFVSGIPGSAATGNTQAQTAEVLTKLGVVLKEQGYGWGDVVNAKVYLVGDPKLDGKLDFAGMNVAFKEVFGPQSGGNKPSRVTTQVAALAGPGSLVEIELTAAKAPAAKK